MQNVIGIPEDTDVIDKLMEKEFSYLVIDGLSFSADKKMKEKIIALASRAYKVFITAQVLDDIRNMLNIPTNAAIPGPTDGKLNMVTIEITINIKSL